MKKAVVFDMDGVLIDSQPLHYEIDMNVLKKCGYQANLETVTPYTGMSNPDRWPIYKSSLNLDQKVETLISMQEQIMMETFKNVPLSAIEGIPSLLDQLNKKGLKCAVASSSSHELINLVLERTGIRKYFDALISGEDVTNGKPHPDIYLHAAKVLDVTPKDCVAIEDSPNGLKSAKSAGFFVIAYRNPTTYGQEFTHADHIVDDYDSCGSFISKMSVSV